MARMALWAAQKFLIRRESIIYIWLSRRPCSCMYIHTISLYQYIIVFTRCYYRIHYLDLSLYRLELSVELSAGANSR